MAPNEKSKRASRKTATKTKRKKTPTRTEREPTKTTNLPKLDQERTGNNAMDRMPSNAPTMAIAPSDYEHIFHEGPGQSTSPTATQDESRKAKSPQQDFVNITGGPSQSPQTPQMQQQQTQMTPTTNFELQVTPDGYTLLGQPPLDMNSSSARRVAYPSHLVRANNQFSRAALARVSKYLASRAEF